MACFRGTCLCLEWARLVRGANLLEGINKGRAGAFLGKKSTQTPTITKATTLSSSLDPRLTNAYLAIFFALCPVHLLLLTLYLSSNAPYHIMAGESRYARNHASATAANPPAHTLASTVLMGNRQELLGWPNNLLQLNVTKVEQCGTGYECSSPEIPVLMPTVHVLVLGMSAQR